MPVPFLSTPIYSARARWGQAVDWNAVSRLNVAARANLNFWDRLGRDSYKRRESYASLMRILVQLELAIEHIDSDPPRMGRLREGLRIEIEMWAHWLREFKEDPEKKKEGNKQKDPEEEEGRKRDNKKRKRDDPDEDEDGEAKHKPKYHRLEELMRDIEQRF